MPDCFRQSLAFVVSASIFLSFVALSTTPVWADVPQFEPVLGDEDFEQRKAANGGKPTLASSDGTVKLKWGKQAEVLPTEAAGELATYQLEQGIDPDFAHPVLRFEGTDVESYLSGLPEGRHYFRVRRSGGDWSIPIEVTVTFIDRFHLFLLLGIGFAVASMTAGAIISGYLRHRHES